MAVAPIIVEIEGYVGAGGEIIVVNALAEDGIGRDDRLFCIASQDDDGVFRLIDWGYATLADAQRAWPEAISARYGSGASNATA